MTAMINWSFFTNIFMVKNDSRNLNRRFKYDEFCQKIGILAITAGTKGI